MERTVCGPGRLAGEGYSHADGRGGQVPYIHSGTDSVIAFVEERLHRIAGGHFEVADHVGGAEHACSFDAQEADCVFAGYEDGGLVSCTDWYVDHKAHYKVSLQRGAGPLAPCHILSTKLGTL